MSTNVVIATLATVAIFSRLIETNNEIIINNRSAMHAHCAYFLSSSSTSYSHTALYLSLSLFLCCKTSATYAFIVHDLQTKT